MSLLDDASLIITSNAVKAGKLYSVVPNTDLGDMTVVRATTATRVNASGLIENVDSNVPRLDYTNASCPSILVEPQRTNLLSFSEEFDNAIYPKAATTVTANNAIAPNGLMTADKLIAVASMANHLLNRINAFTAVVNTQYTLSIYAKASEYNFLRLQFQVTAFPESYANFNLTNGTIGVNIGVTASIQLISNGWYRCTITSTANQSGNSGAQIFVLDSNRGTPSPSYLGDDISGIFIWGAQLEVGSNATSYIPTVATTVTRNADVISKTGISSLIGQTEGVFFAHLEYNFTNVAAKFIALSDGTNNNQIVFYLGGNTNNLFSSVSANGLLLFNNSIKTLTNLNTFFKIAIKYRSGEIKVFVDGQLLFTNTSTFANMTLNRLLLSNPLGGQPFDGDIRSIQLYRISLTDQQCINLTTL